MTSKGAACNIVEEPAIGYFNSTSLLLCCDITLDENEVAEGIEMAWCNRGLLSCRLLGLKHSTQDIIVKRKMSAEQKVAVMFLMKGIWFFLLVHEAAGGQRINEHMKCRCVEESLFWVYWTTKDNIIKTSANSSAWMTRKELEKVNVGSERTKLSRTRENKMWRTRCRSQKEKIMLTSPFLSLSLRFSFLLHSLNFVTYFWMAVVLLAS